MEHDWRNSTVIYQIYPRSFCDSNGDGIGDIRGIIENLDYLQDLGVETLWISPMYPSPQRDFGYDISGFRGIDPRFGTMDDFDALASEVHRRNMKLLLDMVLNHTSDSHRWFKESRSSKDNPKRDWYVWIEGAKRPNNWQSMVHGSGWHFDNHTESWYWASFLPFQPDLNWRNPEVHAYMTDTLRFWLDRGADGFRLDIFDAVLEDASLRNNPFAFKIIPDLSRGYGMFQRTVYNRHIPENFALAREIRKIAEPRKKLLIGEVFGTPDILRAYCGTRNPDGLNLVFQFQCLTAPVTSSSYRKLIQEAETWFPPPFTPTWVFGNHDRRRSIEQCRGRRDPEKLRTLFRLTVRGVPCIYYGEEIGMRQQNIPIRSSQDAVARLLMKRYPPFAVSLIDRMMHGAVNRDSCRTPMQWSSIANAGFCSPDAEPWLPVPDSPGMPSVQDQQQDPASLLNCHRVLLQLRNRLLPLKHGTLTLLDTPDPVLGYVREYDSQTAAVLLNFSDAPSRVSLDQYSVPKKLVYSTAGKVHDPEDEITLSPWEGAVFFS